MESMQDRLTGEVDALVTGLGLRAAQTYGAARNVGNWWITDGNAQRLQVAWRFGADHAVWTLTGPVADHPRNAELDWPGAVFPTRIHLGRAAEDRWEITLQIGYAEPNSVSNALAGLRAVLAPWRTNKSFDDELSRHRVALLDDNPAAATALNRARAALNSEGPGGGRGTAAHCVDEALQHLDYGSYRAGLLSDLSDALAADPAETAESWRVSPA
jgi:hypothetical protein